MSNWKQSLAEVTAGYSIVVAWLACFVLLWSCSCGPIPPPPPPAPGEPTCEGVCAYWSELGCEEAKGSPGGIPCVEVCDGVQHSGIIEWDLECRASVTSCEEIDRCE